MRGRLSVLLVCGLLLVAWGCRGEKAEKEAQPPKATAADTAAEDILAELMAEGTEEKPPAEVKPEPPKVATEEPAKEEPPKVAEEEPKPEPEPAPVLPKTASELDRLFAEMAVREGVDPQASAKAEALFIAGKQLFEDLRYEEALERFRQALRLSPRHRGAAEYAAKTKAILDIGLDPMKMALEQLERSERIKVQEALAKVQNVIDGANRARVEAGRGHPGDENKPVDQVLSRKRKSAEEALKAYDRALEVIRWLPYQVDLSTVRQRVQAAKSETDLIIRGLDEQLAAYRRDQAEKARTEGRARAELFFYHKIRAMLDRAKFDFRQGRYEESEAICEQVLRLDPKNGAALALRAQAREKKHLTREARTYRDYKIEFRSSMQAVADATVAHTKPLVYPDNWQSVVMLRSQQLGMGSEAEPEWMTDIRRKLEKKVNFEFVQAPLSEAISFLQQVSDVNMIIDPAVKAGGGEKPITLKMTQASLKLALDWILKLAGLDYELRDNAVFISTSGSLKPETNMVIYDIQDLILAIPDFPGPEMDLLTGAGGALPVFNAAPPVAQNDEAQIVDMIKQRIRPDSWGPNQGTSIEPRNGKLVVVQRPEVHRMITSLLADLRSTQKVLVVVEGRLLEISDGVLEDIGINWGTTDNTVGAPTTYPGAQYSRGALSTVGSVINNNLMFSPEITRLFQAHPYFVSANGWGGMSGEFSFINSLQLRAILHAVHMEDAGAELQAPKLVVHNGQRAHMWVGTQRAYVSGWTASGDNPVPTVNNLLTGVVFDVRPIVSADRRYITLELRPTFTELLRMPASTSIQLTVDPNNGLVRVITTITELPDVRVSRVRTSVTIPDGGIILTGGRMRDVEWDSEAGVPFLKDIPFLGRLFRWNRKDYAREHLAILVTAKTLLFDEEERKL